MKENLYISYLEKEAANELSDSEKKELSEWLAASAENRETAQIYRQILTSSAGYSKPVEVDLNARFSELEAKIYKEETPVRNLKPRFNWLRVAATFALLIGAFYAYQTFTQPVELYWVSLGIAEGEQEEILFSDGSKMILNGGSEIVYPEEFAGKERRVKLIGEAFFEVKKNPTQPFIVELENGEVRVLGTSFNIDAKPDAEKVSVFVKTGTVQFATKTDDKSSKVILTKNEVGIFDKTENTLKKSPVKNANEISWLTRKINFQSSPMNEALEEIGDFYNVKISLENADLGACPLDLTLTSDDDLDSALETIQTMIGAEYTKVSEKEYQIKGGSCN